MKIAYLTTLYPEYAEKFYRQHPNLRKASHKEQKAALNYDHFTFGDGYQIALKNAGSSFETFFLNATILQTAWANEKIGPNKQSLEKIALAQIKEFKPDVLWFDDHHYNLLDTLRKEIPSIRLVMGYSGSAMFKNANYKNFDLVISCAQEVVDYLNSQNIKAVQLHHGFNPDILSRINKITNDQKHLYDIIFIGQLLLNKDFHLNRHEILSALVKSSNITIFTTNSGINPLDLAKILRNQALGKTGISLREISFKLQDYFTIKRSCRPPIFALEAYKTIQQSKITFNIHADSSPRFASNARLFEITGAGSCLLTDWKKNINDLFVDGKECVTYRNTNELLDKLKWLLNDTRALHEIALAGQKKTLELHTFTRRAEDLLKIISNNIK